MLTVLLWHVLNIDVKVVKNRDVDGALAARPKHRRGGHHRREVDCAPVARPVRVIISVMLTVPLRHVLNILLRHVRQVIISVTLTVFLRQVLNILLRQVLNLDVMVIISVMFDGGPPARPELTARRSCHRMNVL